MKIKKVVTYLKEDKFPYLEVEETGYTVDGRKCHNTPEMIYELAKDMRMTERATEMVMLFIFDNANQLICVHELSTGSINRSLISSREIAQTILLAGGINCALVHNHPSGDTTPSDADIMVTKKIKEALELLQLRLLDHLVVGRYGYTSMIEKGLLV